MSSRVSIEVSGFAHANPVPAASRIGPILFSGVLTGRDPVTHRLPASLESQCANVFRHVRALMEAAGGSIDDIIKLTFWLDQYRDRDALNREWTAMFPDPGCRPARQCMAAQLDGGTLVQCDVVAVIAEHGAL